MIFIHKATGEIYEMQEYHQGYLKMSFRKEDHFYSLWFFSERFEFLGFL